MSAATISQTETILIVDDNPTNIQVLFAILNEAGYEVGIAKSGEVAFQRLQFFQPDLILLDVMMPGIDGFEVCRRLKADPATCDIPVIFMTALSDTVDKVKGLSLGAVDYLTKPIQHEEAIARIRVHLQLRASQKALEQRTTELSETLANLKHSQVQMVQSEKMASLGELVAGIAHEINNPVGFIVGNLQPAQEYIHDLFHILSLYQKELPEPSASLKATLAELDLEYIQEDLPKLVHSMKEGVHRISHLSQSLRTFSRADQDRLIPFNLHDGIDSTLMILQYRLKATSVRPAIAILKQYGSIPNIECYAGQLNQVFMNLLANAIDALEELSPEAIRATPPQIQISTELTADNQISIRIQDTGAGMTEAVSAKIFESLFTTKAVGKGTGLGLAIAHQIIVEKHQGTIHVNSAPNQGTEFVLTIPVKLASS
jgi:two-component system, NtrC family, sensor kinase